MELTALALGIMRHRCIFPSSLDLQRPKWPKSPEGRFLDGQKRPRGQLTLGSDDIPRFRFAPVHAFARSKTFKCKKQQAKQTNKEPTNRPTIQSLKQASSHPSKQPGLDWKTRSNYKNVIHHRSHQQRSNNTHID